MNAFERLFPTGAFISDDARIEEGAALGAGVVIEGDVVIGSNAVIGHHVVIRSGVRIGPRVRVGDHTVLGKLPSKAANSATTGAGAVYPPLEIGAACVIGAHCVIYRGASLAPDVFVGDLATIREEVAIGERTIVGRGVAIENKTRVGRRAKIETNAYITAMSEIGDYCFVAPGVVFTNDNFVGRTEERKKHFGGPKLLKGCRIGAGAVLLPGVTVGEDALVAAGALVTCNAPPRQILMGSPARVVRPVPAEQLLENQIFYEPAQKA